MGLSEGGLVAAADADFYGTTSEGGFNNRGTAFEISSYSNHFVRLHSFHSNDGGSPEGAMVPGTNGNIYGTTENGGLMAGVCLQYGRPHGCGTVFSLSGIRPFVETVQPAGKVGDVITILGSNLTGATGVSFGLDGTPLKFSVVSDNEINATIPEGGAGSTVIYVFMDGWWLQSNVTFHVLP
jgi:hypothetical protein